ncbi:MAG: hypothetical protein IPK60_03685 [Sandaracinaceae bacterium]|nr:hypothetical protein [Sandaracinaceae bacterium]
MLMRRCLSLCLFLTSALLVGCPEPLDVTRVIPQRGTLGEEIYKILCQRIASTEFPTDVTGDGTKALCEGREEPNDDTPARLRALASNRTRLVDALDQTMPDGLHDDLSAFMMQLIPLYDPPRETLPEQTRAVADALANIAGDTDALTALQRLSAREGYRPARLAIGVSRPLLTYPNFDDFAGKLLRAVDDDGAAGPQFDHLLQVLSLEMATSQTSFATGPTTLGLARDLLYTSSDAFGGGSARWLVRRDERGIVLPSDGAGGIGAPFVDTDSDGLADVDSLGLFVDASGQRLNVPAPFPINDEFGIRRDAQGRALHSDDTPYYDYMDANRTLLAALMRESHGWFDPATPAALDLADGIPLFLGPPATQTEVFGNTSLQYEGYDTAHGPIFDLVHGTGSILYRPETDDMLAVVDELLRNHEDVVAPVIDSIWYAMERGDAYPNASIPRTSDFWDDMVHVVEGIAEVQNSAGDAVLLDALMRAFEDPASADLGFIAAQMCRYKDAVLYDTRSDELLNGHPNPQSFSQLTDFSAPDVDGNESVLQRSLALIHDLNGVQLCNKEGASIGIYSGDTYIGSIGNYARCELIQIDNVAAFYVQSVLGEARMDLKPQIINDIRDIAGSFVNVDAILDDTLSANSHIVGLDSTPTPEALGRLVWGPRTPFIDSLLEVPMTRDGVPVAERYPNTAQAWELEFTTGSGNRTFLDALKPLLRAFNTYNPQPNPLPATPPRFLFGELIDAMYMHWASPNSDRTQTTDPAAPFYVTGQDNVRSYEPIIADLFSDGQLFPRLRRLLLAVDAMSIHTDVDGIGVLAQATQTLVDPESMCIGSCGVGETPVARDGREYVCTNSGTCYDGTGGHEPRRMSALYLLLDALHGMDDALEANPARRIRWHAGRHAMTHQLLAVNGTQLSNRRSYAILLTVLPFLRDRIAAHEADGDLREWSEGLAGRMETSLGSAMGVSTFQLVEALQNDPEATEALERLMMYMLDESSPNEAFDSTLIGAADLLQVLEDQRNMVPLLHALSNVVAPNARQAIEDGTTIVTTDGSAVDKTLALLRAIRDLDDRHVMPFVLQNLVTPGSDTEQTTPLEIIVDVIAEVNRTEPGASGPLSVDDFNQVMTRTHDFLTDGDHGLERAYRAIQNRQVTP